MRRRGRGGARRGPGAVAALAALQSIAAAFFLADAGADLAAEGLTAHLAVEATIALALLGGVVAGIWQVRTMLAEARRRDTALALAAGAFSTVVGERFREWKLTPAEADVAVFALKGCDVAEIAALRKAAQGTVRAQLARIYDKAGVSSRSALASLFLEDLLTAESAAAMAGPQNQAVPARLAVYGTLAPGRENHRELDGLRGRWSRGSVHGRLYPNGWGAALGYPGLVLDDAGPAVAVQLFESPDLAAHWARLDAFEGPGYRRVTTAVESAGGRQEACIYVLAEDPAAAAAAGATS